MNKEYFNMVSIRTVKFYLGSHKIKYKYKNCNYI